MKRCYLVIFLLLLICVGCKKEYKEKAERLTEEFSHTDLLSTRFDSLMNELKELPVNYRLPLLLKIEAEGKESEKEIIKREALLLEALNIAPQKEKKEILFLIVKHYAKHQISAFYYDHAISEEYKRCIELENQYSLSEEEQLKVSKFKTNLFNTFHEYEKKLALHYQILETYQKQNNPEMIIDQLHSIGVVFGILGDIDKAASLYEEAYQLTIKHKLPELQIDLLPSLASAKILKKEYSEAIKIYEKQLKLSSPDRRLLLYHQIADSYMKIDSTATARLFLFKRIDIVEKEIKKGDTYRYIASTYIQDENEDSARYYLQKAIDVYKKERIRINAANIQELPYIFIGTYTDYAGLLEKKGKYQEALEAFQIIEPTLTRKKSHSSTLSMDIKAYSTLSSLYEKTGAYKKALETLQIRDSIQKDLIEQEVKLNKQNIINLYKNKELVMTIERQNEQLANSHKVILLIMLLGTAIIGILLVLYLMYRLKKRQLEIIYKKQKEIDELKNKKTEEAAEASPEELLFEATKKLILDKALFKKADLTLENLAVLMNTNRTYLSSCINTCSGKNFSQWLNEYRIDYVVRQMSQTNDLSQLAKDAGFASTASFYRYFKQHTQITPKQYLEQLKVGA